MRRTILLVVIAVLAAMVLPVVGVGQPATTHSGAPTDVFTSGHPRKCARVTADGVDVMPTQVDVAQESNLLVYFTGELFKLDPNEYGLFSFEIRDDAGDTFAFTDFEWGWGGNWITMTSPSMMWTFENVPAGTFTVLAHARIEKWNAQTRDVAPGGKANLSDCAMTVMLMPPSA